MIKGPHVKTPLGLQLAGQQSMQGVVIVCQKELTDVFFLLARLPIRLAIFPVHYALNGVAQEVKNPLTILLH